MPLVFLNFIKNNDYSSFNYFLFFCISSISNTFSAISGGGAGLIQLPCLILSGMPYYQALATHKVATVALGVGGSIRNYKSLKINLNILFNILIFGTPGVVLGTFIVEVISEASLYLILGLLSIYLSLYSFRKPDLGLFYVNKHLSLFQNIRFLFFIFLIGILNGSVSSGTGLLMTILLIRTVGMDFISAVSLTFFTVGIFWNAIGAIFLSRIGEIPLDLLAILILGSLLGGFFGAHLSNLKGNNLVKKTFTTVCLLVGISLLIKSTGIIF